MPTTARTTVLYDVPWETYEGILDALPEHRMRHTYQDGTLELFSNLIYDVSWEAYEKVLKAFGDRRFPHTYQDGTLEIYMSPSEDHEQIKGFIGRMIETMSVELGVRTKSVGSATRRHKKLAQGLEPDESYYINPVPSELAAPTNKKPAPDLVLEVDMRRSVLKRMASYAKLAVREVWRYRKGSVEFFGLQEDGKYVALDRSNVFPVISAQDVTRFVARMKETDEYSTILEFIKWVRKQDRKN